MTTNVTEYAIVKRIMKVLKLDEAGKISKFFDSIIKDCKRAIEQLENNKKVLAINYATDTDRYSERIEDAADALEAAYDNVTLEDVKTNDTITSFKETYLNRVSNAERKLKGIEKELEKYKENYENQLKEIEEQIVKYKARINKIVNLK